MEAPDNLSQMRFSRRTLLKGAGAGAMGLTLAQAGLLRSAAAASESVSDIVNIAITAEELAITLLTNVIKNASGYDQPIKEPVLSVLKGALASEVYHRDYLAKAGATPLTQAFTVPDPKILSDYDTLFTTVVQLESAFVAAYTAAAAEFADMGKPELVKVAFQIGAVEAEHRVLANYALGHRPANNMAFEANLFGAVGDAAAALKKLGFIGGSGKQVSYPGTSGADLSYVSHTYPGGPSVSCMPAMPGTGGGGMAGTSGEGGLEQMLGILGLFGVGAAVVGVLTRRLTAQREERAEQRAD